MRTALSDRSSRIAQVDVKLIRIPCEEPYGDAIQKFTALELPMVFIADEQGNSGVGFGYTIGQGGSTIVELLNGELAPKLIGKDSRAIASLGKEIKGSIHALTPGCISSNALAAIDVALWDLAGKRLNTPLHLLLGGAKEKILIYNTHVGWLSRPLDEMLELCDRAVRKEGFRAVKLKVGKPDPEEDLERVAKVREVVGSDVTIFTDANQSWTINEAIPRLKKLEPFELGWIEEPLLATDTEGYHRLGQHIQIPRAGGESLCTTADFYHCVKEDALDILQPDVARIGGITKAMQVASLASAANLKVAPHVSPELSLVVACAISNSFCIEFIPQMEPVLKEKIKIREGCAIPSSHPGHGILFDPEALERYEVKHVGGRVGGKTATPSQAAAG